MRHLIPVAALCLMPISLPVTAVAAASEYSWALSWSAENPDSVSIESFRGAGTAYLWLNCSDFDGMAAAELDIETTSLLVAGFQPMNGVLNIGTPQHLKFAVGGCPTAPFLVGSFSVLGQGGDASMCLGETRLTVDCGTVSPSAHPSGARGCVAGSGDPCEVDLCAPPTEADSAAATPGEPEDAAAEPLPEPEKKAWAGERRSQDQDAETRYDDRELNEPEAVPESSL